MLRICNTVIFRYSSAATLVISVICLEKALSQRLVPSKRIVVHGSVRTVWLHHLEVRSDL